MPLNDAVIAVFADHPAAETAVKKLAADGFEMKNLSVVGKGYHTEEKVVGFYNLGDRVKFWGTRGAFWGGLWGLFFGGLFMTVPLVGHVIILGYLAATRDFRSRKRSPDRWIERSWRGSLQYRHAEGQRGSVRDRCESRWIYRHGAWDGGRNGTRKEDPERGRALANRYASRAESDGTIDHACGRIASIEPSD